MDTLTNLVDIHLIEIIEQRDLSIHVAEALDVRHESPQIILFESGELYGVVHTERLTRIIHEYVYRSNLKH